MTTCTIFVCLLIWIHVAVKYLVRALLGQAVVVGNQDRLHARVTGKSSRERNINANPPFPSREEVLCYTNSEMM